MLIKLEFLILVIYLESLCLANCYDLSWVALQLQVLTC